MIYPDFIKNETFYALNHSKSREEQLVWLTENIKKIHALTTKNFENFEMLIAEYLKYGIEIFHMQTGIVSNITDKKEYIIKDVVTNLDVIHPGDIFELEGTYCREVYKTHHTLGFPKVGNLPELKSHPVYVNLKLEAYISAPIFVRDKMYGTLNFTSLIEREYGFSEYEHDLISMMAQSIGNFILLQEKENHLKHLNFRMKELVGHVAHDLRNPIGAIQGLSQMMTTGARSQEQIVKMATAIKDESTRSLELINSILIEAALGTGKVVMNKDNFNIVQLLDDVLNSFKILKDERNIIINLHIPSKLKTFGDAKRIRQILDNLILNALKYSQQNSKIEISLIPKNNKIECKIINKKTKQNVILDKTLYKSVGYGMDIIEEILKQHDTQLQIYENIEIYQVTFELPLEVK